MFEFIFYVCVICMGGGLVALFCKIGRANDEKITQYIVANEEKRKDIERRKKFDIDVK